MRDSPQRRLRCRAEAAGNILGMGIELDGIVAFIADRSAASLLEIQCASENLLGCIGQCALDIDLGIRLLPIWSMWQKKSRCWSPLAA